MKIIVETERLYLREFLQTEAKHLYNLNADPDVIQYTGDDKFSSVEVLKTHTFL